VLISPTFYLQKAFTHTNPKSTKKAVKFSVFFCAFGICTCISCLMKLTPVSQFHEHFTSSFFANFLLPKNYKHKLWAQKSFAKKLLLKKDVNISAISPIFFYKILQTHKVLLKKKLWKVIKGWRNWHLHSSLSKLSKECNCKCTCLESSLRFSIQLL